MKNGTSLRICSILALPVSDFPAAFHGLPDCDLVGILKIAAARQIRDAEILAPPEGSYDEFCARFPFAETEDQLRAIADVLEDLASGRPMDRLVGQDAVGDLRHQKIDATEWAAIVSNCPGTTPR